MENEIWKPIPFLKNLYEASSVGRVRRTVDGKDTQAWGVLSARLNRYGYLRLWTSANGRQADVTVHKCVANAFLGPKPDGMQVNHLNGIKADNRPGNLEYVTASENMAHAMALGLLGLGTLFSSSSQPLTPTRGEKHGAAKINEAQAHEIITRYQNKQNTASIASLYGISNQQVYRIGTGQSWKHLRL